MVMTKYKVDQLGRLKTAFSTEGGSSRDGCLETYHGEEAFSEPESKVLRDTLLSIANQTKCYMTFHAYGQYWLTPWGFTADLPDDYDDLVSISMQQQRFVNNQIFSFHYL